MICIKAVCLRGHYNEAMNFPRRILRWLPFSLLAAIATVSFVQAKPQASYDVTGIIREKLSEKSLLIAHDEIPDYMAAMTMVFDLADPREGAALKTGDRVRFRLRPIDDRWLVDRFIVLGKAAPPPSTAAKVTRLRPGDALPPLTLLDEHDRPLTLATLQGRFTLVTFIFTRCPVPEFCPAMAMKFGAIQNRIEQSPRAASGEPSLLLLSITLDPEFDRPAILAAYGKGIGANPEIWNFATGDAAEIANLARRFAVFTERKGVTLDHTLCTALVGPDGRVREIWRGNGWSSDEVFAFLNTQSDYTR